MPILAEHDHILVSTFEPDVDTVERVVPIDATSFGWWTPDAADAERLRGGQVVMVRACNRSGKVDVEYPLVEGRAEVLAEGPLFDEVRAKTHEKYGLGTTLDGLRDKARGIFGDKTVEAVVVVTVV